MLEHLEDRLTPSNLPPVAVNDSYNVHHNQWLSENVLYNDYDPDGYFLEVTEVNGNSQAVNNPISLASGASLYLSWDGSFSYLPAPGTTDPDSFTYSISDGVATATATVFINITNQVPVAVDDFVQTDEQSPLSSTVLPNDYDPDGDFLTVAEVNGEAANVGEAIFLPSGALLYVAADGTFTYDPVTFNAFAYLNQGETATDYFTYTISDGCATATATVTIIINGLDYSGPTYVWIGPTDWQASETGPDSGEFTVYRYGNLAESLTVFYSVSGTATNGEDYEYLGGTVVIPANETTATITVLPIANQGIEDMEEIEITLAPGANYVLGSVTSAVAWISADPVPQAPPVDIMAYRPQNPVFQRTPVPPANEIIPGVGIRFNGDDDNNNAIPDRNEEVVGNENDLIEIELNFGAAQAPEGIEYYLSRSNTSIKVWLSEIKWTPVLDENDEQQLPFNPGNNRFWVEWVNPTFDRSTRAILTFEARDAQTGGVVGNPPSVHFVPFTSVVIVIGGNGQVPSEPARPGEGIFEIGRQLYAIHGYDVHMFPETAQNSGGENIGRGAGYNEILNGVNRRGVTFVAIIGFSWGGGATYNLANRLVIDRGAGIIANDFTIAFTGYIDAIMHGPLFFGAPETRRPPSSQFHFNYYQRIGTPGELINIRGTSIPPSDIDINVNNMEWGVNLNHITIDDNPNVQNDLIIRLVNRLDR